MPLFSSADRRTAEAIVGRAYCNPFLPERVEFERRALGADFVATSPLAHLEIGESIATAFPNLPEILNRAESLVSKARETLCSGRTDAEHELQLYEDLALFLLYSRYMSHFDAEIVAMWRRQRGDRGVECWRSFREDFEHLLQIPGVRLPGRYEAHHAFACFFQFHRAFSQIFEQIIGSAMSVARLRASVWESLFTHDLRRYARVLYRQMGNITTLITGPTGTGKELVARCLAFSRYIPFEVKTQKFGTNSYHALNLSALAPTLIESELFGHRKGTFTGAVSDRQGWLEKCGSLGTVFLDEIGELAPGIQVKLLRVLQEREFQRLGESGTRKFKGKIVTATNRDLAAEMREGRFREDLYFRLCSDVIQTPSLGEQLAESPEDLQILVRYISRQVLQDDPEEADRLSDEVVTWIDEHLGPDYLWPGNIRELEQCVRNVMIRHEYQPALHTVVDAATNPLETFLSAVRQGAVSADELISKYYAIVLNQAGSYQEAARRLGINWQTVKNRASADYLEEISRRDRR